MSAGTKRSEEMTKNNRHNKEKTPTCSKENLTQCTPCFFFIHVLVIEKIPIVFSTNAAFPSFPPTVNGNTYNMTTVLFLQILISSLFFM